MSRTIFFVTVFIFLFTMTACNNNYNIEGVVAGSERGDVALLYGQKEGEFVLLDSTSVTDGKFRFYGTQDSAIIGVLTIKNMTTIMPPLFFVLQNGNITITIDSVYKAEGTELNDKFSVFNNDISIYESRIDELNKLYSLQYNSGILTDSLYRKLREQYTQEEKSIEEITKEYVAHNNDNVTGIYVFIQNSFLFTPQEQRNIIAKAPESFQNNILIKRMSKMLDLMNNVEIGMPFINLTMQNPEGNMISLSDYVNKGKYVLVDFWASWCAPCRKLTHQLLEIYKLYHNKNFEIVGISFDSDREAWKEYIKNYQIRWPQMSDLQGWGSEAIFMYAIQGIPHTVLLNPKGEIIAKDLKPEELDEKLKELLQ